MLAPTSQELELDPGTDGPAALSRPSTVEFVVPEGQESRFRNVGVEVRRYATTQLDSLRMSRVISYRQFQAGRHATALFRDAGIVPPITSRYEEWVSGARGQWVSTDEADDSAAPWRMMLRELPARAAQALEALVLCSCRPSQLLHVREALDLIAEEIGA